MHNVILSLGGNLGDKPKIFKKTKEYINDEMGVIINESSIYESPPWGFESETFFLNQVVEVKTNLEPDEILEKIRIIEAHFGRKRKEGEYISRRMDIDILYYDNLIKKSTALIIPHPLIYKRRFVLVPLVEIAPAYMHPEIGKTNRQLLDVCDDFSKIEKYDPD